MMVVKFAGEVSNGKVSQKYFLFQKPLAKDAPSEKKANLPIYCVITKNRMKVFLKDGEGHPLAADIDGFSKHFMGNEKLTLPNAFELSSEGGSHAVEIAGGKLEFKIDLKAYSAEMTWTKN